MTKDADIKEVVDHIIQEDGRLDILVNNAGALAPGASFHASIRSHLFRKSDTIIGALLDNSLEEVENAFNLNTFSILRVSRAVISHMATRRSGLIINVGSVVGEMCVWLVF